MLDPAGMPAALCGIDAIVHCAVGNRAVTIDGTQALLRAADAAGVRRFVHISTISVYGGAKGRVDETTPMISPISIDEGLADTRPWMQAQGLAA